MEITAAPQPFFCWGTKGTSSQIPESEAAAESMPQRQSSTAGLCGKK
jgi:hypothetical protein